MKPYSFLEESLEGIGIKEVKSIDKTEPIKTLKLQAGKPEVDPGVKIDEYEIDLMPKPVEIKD